MILKRKGIKCIGLFSFAVLMSIYSCTKKEIQPAEKKSDQHQTVKADTAVTKSAVLLLGPDEEEIEGIKKKQGEDNFYTIADDANYYSAEIYEAIPAAIYTSYRIIDFPKENYIFDKNKSEDKWLVIDYKAGSQPKIYSLVDYYRHITEK